MDKNSLSSLSVIPAAASSSSNAAPTSGDAFDFSQLQLVEKPDRHGERRRWYVGDPSRDTMSDGLVFTPDDNNFMMNATPFSLLKWKFLSENTIDLKVKSPFVFRDQIRLFAG